MIFLKKIEQRAHIGKIFARWQVEIDLTSQFRTIGYIRSQAGL